MRSYTRSHRRRHEPVLDGLPELMHFADTGCEVSSSCLTCPLPQCKYDDPAWYQAYKRAGRDSEMLTALDDGLSIFEVATRLSVSPRTVHRALKRSRAPAAVAG